VPYPKDLPGLKARQRENLTKALNWAYGNSRYYRELLDQHRINHEKIKDLKDFQRLPVTIKPHLRERNWDFVCIDRSQWLDAYSTSGSTGSSVFIPLSRADLNRMAKFGGETLKLIGLNKKDLVQLTLPMGNWMWAAGHGFYYCYTSMGAGVLRFGPGFTEKQIEIMEKLEPTVVHGIPSFLVKLGEAVKTHKPRIKVKKVVSIAENVMAMDLSKNQLGRKIEALWGVPLFSTYGASEGPFLCGECRMRKGHHIHPDEMLVEILDPNTYQPLPDGEKGLLAFTSFGVKGFPLLRYIPGDLSFLLPEPCSCGAVSQMLGPIYARNDHMMKIKGVMIYPERVSEAIAQFEGVSAFQLEAYTENYMDQLRVYFAPRLESEPALTGQKLQNFLKQKLGIKMAVIPQDEQQLGGRIFPTGTNKAKIFLDNRSSK